MEEQQKQLFGLMTVAQEQQRTVQAALEGLAQERVQLAKERAALAQAAAGMVGAAGEVRSAAAQAVPAMQRAVGEAVGASVKQSLAGASEAATQALAEATKPVMGSLSSVVQAAHDAEGSMRRAGAWFAWKWVAIAAGGLVGVCLVAYAALGWQLLRIQNLGDEKAALQAEVTQLQAQAEDWAKRAGRAKLERCGKKSRLCVRVEKDVGYSDTRDYFILKGY